MWNEKRVRKLLKQHGESRKWLAHQCGINVNSLSRVLEGRAPGMPVQMLMALALGTSVEYLNSGKKENDYE